MKKSKIQEEKRLMNRWVFDVANLLMDDENVSRKVAFRQAHLVRELLDALGRGEVRFAYQKKDGTLREARGTLCHGISEAFDSYDYKVADDLKDAGVGGTNFVYWDMEREAFRSFAAMNVKKIVEVKM